MAEGSEAIDGQVYDQELSKHYKRCLENWREVLIHLNSLFLWDKPYYPGIIAAYITFIFLILWYFEPSILTTLSILGIIVCIVDFAVPLLSCSIFDPNKWTGVQERKFEEICHNLVWVKRKTLEIGCTVSHFKETKPKMYFFAVLTTLIITAWIGNIIDNLFLTYVIILGVSLLPGIRHHGILQEYIAQATVMIKEIIAQKEKKNN